ncbi:hypothetical protein PRIC2_007669 [Phytophthora ramorum]
MTAVLSQVESVVETESAVEATEAEPAMAEAVAPVETKPEPVAVDADVDAVMTAVLSQVESVVETESAVEATEAEPAMAEAAHRSRRSRSRWRWTQTWTR